MGKAFLKVLMIAAVATLLVGGFFVFKKIYKQRALPKIAQIKEKISTPGPLIGETKPTRAKQLESEEIIKWTNFYRKQNNLSSLSENTALTKAANKKVTDMFEKQYFAHISPTGQGAADLVKAEGYQFKVVGENLALGDFQDEKDLVDAWMGSPGHKANILNFGYKEIGVAAKLSQYQGRTTWMAVQIFATVAPRCPSPDPQLKKEIEEKEALNSQISQLNQEAASLLEQGNEKIRQGNEIYQQTGDKSQAEPYWTEGENLQKQGEEKLNEAAVLGKQVQDLESLINQYNKQVEAYNQCIGE